MTRSGGGWSRCCCHSDEAADKKGSSKRARRRQHCGGGAAVSSARCCSAAEALHFPLRFPCACLTTALRGGESRPSASADALLLNCCLPHCRYTAISAVPSPGLIRRRQFAAATKSTAAAAAAAAMAAALRGSMGCFTAARVASVRRVGAAVSVAPRPSLPLVAGPSCSFLGGEQALRGWPGGSMDRWRPMRRGRASN